MVKVKRKVYRLLDSALKIAGSASNRYLEAVDALAAKTYLPESAHLFLLTPYITSNACLFWVSGIAEPLRLEFAERVVIPQNEGQRKTQMAQIASRLEALSPDACKPFGSFEPNFPPKILQAFQLVLYRTAAEYGYADNYRKAQFMFNPIEGLFLYSSPGSVLGQFVVSPGDFDALLREAYKGIRDYENLKGRTLSWIDQVFRSDPDILPALRVGQQNTRLTFLLT